MKITFLGATKTVTGSNFLVEAAGKRFLVDCGMWQGNAELEMQNAEEFEFDPNQIDFMLLTHAHIDHSGRIPKLYNEGFRNKIYAHKATCDLCTLMLPDSGHIQEMEIEWKNKKRKRKGEKEVPPLYTAEEAARCLEIFEPIQYDEIIEIILSIAGEIPKFLFYFTLLKSKAADQISCGGGTAVFAQTAVRLPGGPEAWGAR